MPIQKRIGICMSRTSQNALLRISNTRNSMMSPPLAAPPPPPPLPHLSNLPMTRKNKLCSAFTNETSAPRPFATIPYPPIHPSTSVLSPFFFFAFAFRRSPCPTSFCGHEPRAGFLTLTVRNMLPTPPAPTTGLSLCVRHRKA